MITSTKLLTAALVCASWASAARIPRHDHQVKVAARAAIPGTFVGYRYLSNEEFQNYIKAGRVTYDRDFDHSIYGEQLGPGLYTAKDATLKQYPGRNVCAIVADDSDKFSSTDKYNVPKDNGCDQIWFKNDKVEEYGKTLNPAWTNDNTIRLSQFSGGSTVHYQACVGADVLDNNIYRYDCCKPRDDNCVKRLVADYGSADYKSWKITGGSPA